MLLALWGPVVTTFQTWSTALRGRSLRAKFNMQKRIERKKDPKPSEEASAWVILVPEVFKGCFIVFKLYFFLKKKKSVNPQALIFMGF